MTNSKRPKKSVDKALTGFQPAMRREFYWSIAEILQTAR